MDIKLEIAATSDAQLIFDIQVKSFTSLLEKYKDYETNPAIETIGRVKTRINNPNGSFLKIIVDNKLIGAICVSWKEEGRYWISPMFILPTYQGEGIAQKAITEVERIFPEAVTWELATLLEDERNCYLYEKMGYKKLELVRN